LPSGPLESFDFGALPMVDQRAREQMMKQFRQQDPSEGDSSPLSEAQELVYQAYETDDDDQRLALAQEALAICPDCADAYVCVGEMLPSADEAVQWFAWAVEAGERALGGPEGLTRYEKHFWDAWETRPYMRARLELAQSLWHVGDRDQAMEHCRRLLELNPGDNQGVRYVLCSYYCDSGRDDELAGLLQEYEDDDTADWHFSRALLAFRSEGDTDRARQRLQEANQANPHVAPLLVGTHMPPAELPHYVSIGDPSEAAHYVIHHLPAWRSTPGAVTWVRKTLRVPLADEPEAPETNWDVLLENVGELPQCAGETWDVDVRKSPLGSRRSDSRKTLWVMVVASADENELIAIGPCGEGSKPTPAAVLAQLLEAMENPREGEPRRPECVRVRLKTYVKSWSKRLDSLDVACQQDDTFPYLDHVFEMMADMGHVNELTDDELADCTEAMINLPRVPGQVWQVGMRKLAVWIAESGEPQRPWAALVLDRTNDLILAQDLTLEVQDAGFLWKVLAGAILAPAVGESHLPESIEVETDQVRGSLLPYLEPLGVDCRVCPGAEQLNFVFGELAESLGDSSQPALIDTPGVKPAHVGGLFAAAEAFYRAQPWRHVPGDTPIRIHCDQFQNGTWYAVVMGQSGMTLGLALYEDLDVLHALLREDDDADRRNSALTLLYGEAFEIPIRDLDAAEERGWPVAGPEAYPLAIRVNPGMAVRPPLAWEMQLLEASLRAVPKYILREEPTPARMNLPVATGELQLELSWLE
jgi:tetratricopeptide (TPR) repeat protein